MDWNQKKTVLDFSDFLDMPSFHQKCQRMDYRVLRELKDGLLFDPLNQVQPPHHARYYLTGATTRR